MIKLYLGLILLFFSMLVMSERDNITCGIKQGLPLDNAYGPYDYTNPLHQSKLPIVLGAHFTKDVEMLIRGTTASTPHGDIDYTLRAIPNFHRALYAMSRLQIRDGLVSYEGFRYYTSRCYFERAIYLNSKDEISFMLYGLHLHRVGNLKGAVDKYNIAESLGLGSAEFYHNRGLLSFDLGEYAQSRTYYKRSSGLGYPLLGLKNKLDSLTSR